MTNDMTLRLLVVIQPAHPKTTRGCSLMGKHLPVRQETVGSTPTSPTHPDRPVELYSEALNSAAYHAKLEELRPAVAKEPEPCCSKCRQSLSYGSYSLGDLCGDCSAAGHWTYAYKRTLDRNHLAAVRNRPAAPSTHLNAAARYHLQDDAGATGLPEHN